MSKGATPKRRSDKPKQAKAGGDLRFSRKSQPAIHTVIHDSTDVRGLSSLFFGNELNFSVLRLHPFHGTYLAAGVLGVEFVGPVADGVEVIAALHCGIHAIVDSDEADILLGK